MNNPEPIEPVVLEMADAAISSLHAPELIVLDHIDWTVRRGEYWIVGGSPGSGKSDLLATAAGLMRPYRGRHLLLGAEVSRLREEDRLRAQLRVGVVFGSGGRLFNHLTIAENLGLPLCYHNNSNPADPDPRVKAVLDAMDLSQVAEKRPNSLDRNLQQRAALGRALVLSPELLFLDNAVVGTGPRELRWWLQFLEALHRGHPLLQNRPLTLILGTHDLEPWSGHGRQFALVNAGRFSPLGNQAESGQLSDPALRELLPADWLAE